MTRDELLAYAGHLKSMIHTLQSTLAKAQTHSDFQACGKACGMRDHETILGSVLRVVKERNELRSALEWARDNFAGKHTRPSPIDKALDPKPKGEVAR